MILRIKKKLYLQWNSKRNNAMRRTVYAVLLLLGMSMMTFSCGGGNEPDPSTNMPADTVNVPSQQTQPDNSTSTPMVKPASIDSMKMVLDNRGNVVGRYIRTNDKTYTVSVQDDYDVPKSGNKVVTFSAKNGQGILYTRRTHVNIRKEPTTESPVVTQISYVKGNVPETYPCLGKVNDWYQIRVKGKVGYVRQDLVEWDGMDSF